MSLSFWNDPFGIRRMRQFSQELNDAHQAVCTLTKDLVSATLRAQRLLEVGKGQQEEFAKYRAKHREVVHLLGDYFQTTQSPAAKDYARSGLYKWLHENNH